MKELRRHFLCLPAIVLLATVSLFTACSSEDDVSVITDPVEPVRIHFTAQLVSRSSGASLAKPIDVSIDADEDLGTDGSASASRRIIATPDEGDLALDASWEKGEKVGLIYTSGGTKHLVEGTVTEVFSNVNGGYATVEGDFEGVPDNTNPAVKVVYPYAAADENSETGIKANYVNNGQDGTIGTISQKYDVATGDGNLVVSDDDNTVVFAEPIQLENKYAIMRLRFTSDGTPVTGISRLVVSNATTGNELVNVSGSNLQTIYVAMEPVSYGTTLSFSAINSNGLYTSTANIKMVGGITASNYYRSSLKIHLNSDAVQLWEGGPFWAKKNVGATNPEDYGLFFAWGEATGYSSVYADPMTDHSFDWNHYSWSADDIATANWGSAWRMPTHEEIEALRDNVYTDFTDNYNDTGVAGTIMRGKGSYSGNSIFLPAAGFRQDNRLLYQGVYAYFWSSTLNSGGDAAWELWIDRGWFDPHNTLYRYYGVSVRPVLAM